MKKSFNIDIRPVYPYHPAIWQKRDLRSRTGDEGKPLE